MNEQEAWQQRLALLRAQIPQLLRGDLGKTVLYIGASPWRFQMGKELFFEAGYKITLLEAFKLYADHYQGHPWLKDVICGDVRDIAQIADGRTWDVVIWWHGPEHAKEDELASTLRDLEAVAGQLVLLGSPWGINKQDAVGNNPFEQHRIHHGTTDFEKLGYEVCTLGEKDNPLTWCHIMAWKWMGEMPESSTVVYTAVFGGFDRIPPVSFDIPHICFVDQPVELEGWEVRVVERKLNDPRREARMYKALPHLWLPDAETSIWQDGCISLKVEPGAMAMFLGGHDIAVMRHPELGGILEEAKEIVKRGKAPAKQVEEQLAYYRQQDYPVGRARIATGVLVRRHTEAVAHFNEAWWAQITRFTARDQLSFDYVCWKMGMEYAIIPGNLWDNELFDGACCHNKQLT